MEKQIDRPFLPHELLLANGATTEVLVGEKVIQLIGEENFQHDWDELYATCSWGTVFQSRAYVATWYAIYGQEYLPVLVREVSAGRLEGLLTLSLEKPGLLVGAGAEQAEYQVWLCREKDSGAFIQKALKRLRRVFPGSEVRLKYIPGKVSLNWVEKQASWYNRCLIRKHKHPLLEVKEEAIHKELQKKNRREKMNRLKRIGDLSFEKITDVQVFASLFDHLADQFDFRKGAMFNTRPIYSDPLRKGFFLALFNRGMLHATVLMLNKEIIASNIGTKGKRWVHLQGMNTHAPNYAKFSPGILHFLLLGKCLAAEGYEVFDLSPGADSYKDSLATKYTHAFEFRYTNLLNCQINRFTSLVKAKAKDIICQKGIEPASLKKLKRGFAFQKDKIRKVIRTRWLDGSFKQWQQKELNTKDKLIGPDHLSAIQERRETPFLRKGSLRDLLQYDQKSGILTRWEFLREAMDRLETEYEPFTFSADGLLLACVWLKPANHTQNQENAFVLEGAYCHPAYKNKWDNFIGAVAGEVSQNQKTGKL